MSGNRIEIKLVAVIVDLFQLAKRHLEDGELWMAHIGCEQIAAIELCARVLGAHGVVAEAIAQQEKLQQLIREAEETTKRETEFHPWGRLLATGIASARRGGTYLEDARADWLRLQGMELLAISQGNQKTEAAISKVTDRLQLEIERQRRRESEVVAARGEVS